MQGSKTENDTKRFESPWHCKMFCFQPQLDLASIQTQDCFHLRSPFLTTDVICPRPPWTHRDAAREVHIHGKVFEEPPSTETLWSLGSEGTMWSSHAKVQIPRMLLLETPRGHYGQSGVYIYIYIYLYNMIYYEKSCLFIYIHKDFSSSDTRG